MNLFTYVTATDVPFSKQESMERVKKALASNPKWRFAPIQTETDALSFRVRSKRVPQFTAFCPDVTVTFSESDAGTDIRTFCRSKAQARILLPSVAALMLILIIFNLVMTVNGTFHGFSVFLPPILLVLAVCLLTFFGMYLPSKEIQNVIRKAFSANTGL